MFVGLAGCGSSLETTLQKAWQVEAGQAARTFNVEPQREQLLFGKNKSTTVYDADGNVIYGEDIIRALDHESRSVRWERTDHIGTVPGFSTH